MNAGIPEHELSEIKLSEEFSKEEKENLKRMSTLNHKAIAQNFWVPNHLPHGRLELLVASNQTR